MMEFQVKIINMDDPSYSLSKPSYIFDDLCFIALSLARHELEIYQEGVKIFNVYINDMSIGGRLQSYHSWAVWGSMERENKVIDVRVELYIPEVKWKKKKS